MSRVLVVFPEYHNQRKEREAAAAARKFSAGRRVKLFIEGVRPNEVASASSTYGFPITSIEHDLVKPVMNAVGIVETLLRLHALFWAIKQKTHDEQTRKFLANIVQLGIQHAHISSRTGSPLELGLGALLTDASHVIPMAYPSWNIPSTDLYSLVDAISKNHPDYPKKLREIVEKILTRAGYIQLGEQGPTILSDINTFFHSTFGFPVRLGEQPPNPSIAFLADPSTSPVEAEHQFHRFSSSVRIIRELYIARVIASEEFDLGVLNIGFNHARSDSNLMQLLSRTGMEVFQSK